MHKTGMLVAFVFGLALGSTATAAYFANARSSSGAVFQRKIRCKQIAAEFLKENSTELMPVTVDEVTYSPKRNSCVAKLTTVIGNSWDYHVADLLTGESESSGSCLMSTGECGSGKDLEIQAKQERQFKAYVAGR